MKQHSYATEELAAQVGVKPQSLRAALCRDGHWCGIRPVKLPNRRLMWPAAQVNALLKGNIAMGGE